MKQGFVSAIKWIENYKMKIQECLSFKVIYLLATTTRNFDVCKLLIFICKLFICLIDLDLNIHKFDAHFIPYNCDLTCL